MSYSHPPGVSAGPAHPSLPARPPPSKTSKFKPAFAPAAGTSTAPAQPSYPTHTAAPVVTQPQHYGAAAYPAASYGPVAPGPMNGGGYGAQVYPTTTAPSYNAQSYPATTSTSYGPVQPSYQQQQHYYSAPTATQASAAAPAIRNPFPAPGQPNERNADYDPEMAAQIAQWQSAYTNQDDAAAAAAAATSGAGRNGRPGMPMTAGPMTYGANPDPSAYGAAIGVASMPGAEYATAVDPNAAPANPADKKKTVVREGGGKKWTDDTLLEWDPSHFRLFVGNLAGETTDESLLKAFVRWGSVQKARVIRDKRTTKSKGYGFVSFSDADDFFQAAKEMNGKYIQSHPVIVKRSTTEIKSSTVHTRRGYHKGKGRHRDGGGSGSGSGAGAGRGKDGGGYEPSLGPQGGGVYKGGQKTKGGLKLLG